MGIRNKYNLWHDSELVKELGANHPDEAAMIIIKAVWKALRDSDSRWKADADARWLK